MRVLIVNTSERTGGAAIAAHRLKDALINNGIKTKMLVSSKETNNLSVAELPSTLKHRTNFLKERLAVWCTNRFSREHLFEVDFGKYGSDITRLPEFIEADVIHLHWINQGFLSLGGLEKIVRSGKPIVWTMHDMWPFTGICHYAHACRNYILGCHDCPLLARPGAKDKSWQVGRRKEHVYRMSHIAFVACSRWLADAAQQSALLRGARICDIPNPINTQAFRPRDKEKARVQLRLPQDKRLILFSAYRTTLPIKGLDYLTEACRAFLDRHPEMCEHIGIVAMGKDAETLAEKFPCPVYPLGYIQDERTIALAYNASDAFVIPSLQDNLPNTIVEAMSSGVPCVATAVGGIPQMIHHRENGYLAQPRDAKDIALGLEWLFIESEPHKVAEAARSFAVTHYSEQNVAKRYTEIYTSLTGKPYE